MGGALPDALLRQQLVRYLRTCEVGPAARQQSAQAFLLGRAFYEEAALLQRAGKGREEQLQLLSGFRDAAQGLPCATLAQDAPSLGESSAWPPVRLPAVQRQNILQMLQKPPLPCYACAGDCRHLPQMTPSGWPGCWQSGAAWATCGRRC